MHGMHKGVVEVIMGMPGLFTPLCDKQIYNLVLVPCTGHPHPQYNNLLEQSFADNNLKRFFLTRQFHKQQQRNQHFASETLSSTINNKQIIDCSIYVHVVEPPHSYM